MGYEQKIIGAVDETRLAVSWYLLELGEGKWEVITVFSVYVWRAP